MHNTKCSLQSREDREDDSLPTSSLLPPLRPSRISSRDPDLSKSLYNVRHNGPGGGGGGPGAVPPPEDPDAPIGRVKRLLKSNSLNALANINFGWRRETSV